MNSWGSQWGEGGFFKIENADVLDEMKFYDVFWYLSDLMPQEIDYY